MVFAGIEPSSIIHTKLSAYEIVMGNLQNRDWQYLIESLIYNTEKDKDFYKIKTIEDSSMIERMIKNYKILRRIHNDLYKSVADNFKFYIDNLSEVDLEEIDADIVSSGLNSIKHIENSTELLMLFDYFYFINGHFPTTTNILLYLGLIFQLR